MSHLMDDVRKAFPKTAAKADKRSAFSAIKLGCIACMGMDAGFRDNIRNCTDTKCAVYNYRPYQVKNVDNEEPNVKREQPPQLKGKRTKKVQEEASTFDELLALTEEQ